MSMLIMVIGLAQMNKNAIQSINLDPLIYAIVVMGVGLIIIIWFMYEIRLSMSPPGYKNLI
jgi:hypothetical protein